MNKICFSVGLMSLATYGQPLHRLRIGDIQEFCCSVTSWRKHHASLDNTFICFTASCLALPSDLGNWEKVHLSSASWCQTLVTTPLWDFWGAFHTSCFFSCSLNRRQWQQHRWYPAVRGPAGLAAFFFFPSFLTETTSELQWSNPNATFGRVYFLFLFASSGRTLRWKKCFVWIEISSGYTFFIIIQVLSVYVCWGRKCWQHFIKSVQLCRSQPPNNHTGRCEINYFLMTLRRQSVHVTSWLLALCAGAIIWSVFNVSV